MELLALSVLISFLVFIVFSSILSLTFTDEQVELSESNDTLALRESYSFKQKVLITLGAAGASWFFVFGTILVLIKTYMYFKGL